MTRTVLFAEVADFYAAIERVEEPGGDPRPVIVGGNPRRRGLVQAATSDAQAAGVCEGMPVLEALRLCPRARAVRTDLARYREVSRRLFACLRRGFDRLEPFGLGAAYFDRHATTAGTLRRPSPARLRSAPSEEEVGLSLRVGIATAKFLARAGGRGGRVGARRRGCASGDPRSHEAAFLRPFPGREPTRRE